MATLVLQVLLAALGLGATWFVWWSRMNDDKAKKREALHVEWKNAVDSGDPERIANALTRMRAAGG